MVKMANRYIELIFLYEEQLKRKLTLDEIQQIKGIVAKEFDQAGQTSPASVCLDALVI